MSGVSKSSLKEMVVIMLNNTILSVSTNTRILRKGALLSKKQTENTRQVYSPAELIQKT
jgi:guanylate kinase